MKFTKGLFIMVLLFSVHVSVAQKNMYVNSSNGVNMREGPGTNHKAVTSIPNGAEVKVIGTEGDWMKVRYDGKTGYVAKQYVSDQKPQTNSPKSSRSGRTDNGRSTASSGSTTNKNRNWGLGLRLGDPTGVSAKKYFSNGNALEFNLGSTSYWGYDYRDQFYEHSRYHNYDYLGYRRRGAAAFQVHYLFQKNISGVKNLQWYWGLGGQLRSKAYQYNYRYRAYYGPGQGDFVWTVAKDRVRDIDLGADVVFGLEYHLPKAPLSVFADTNMLLELADDPFAVYLQGGIGIRYNF